VLWRHWGGTWPQRIEMDPQHKAVLEHVAKFTCAPPRDPVPTLADHLKAYAHRGPYAVLVLRDFVGLIGQLVLDIGTLIRAPHRGPWRDLSGHLYQFGTTALPITALVGLLIGVVLAYLTSQQLRQYGAETFIVNILGLSLVRKACSRRPISSSVNVMRIIGLVQNCRVSPSHQNRQDQPGCE
jgi:phospholipid/cholesterol/gamma-HCH transport system permease protein